MGINNSDAQQTVIGLNDSHLSAKNKKSLIAHRPPDVIILQVSGFCVVPNFRYSWKCFTHIYRAQYGVGVPRYLAPTKKI